MKLKVHYCVHKSLANPRLCITYCNKLFSYAGGGVVSLSSNPQAREAHVGKHKKLTRLYPKVSGLAAWNENYEWCSSVPLGAVVSLFCETV
jgi:hypothetical protein